MRPELQDQEPGEPTMFDVAMEYALDAAESEQARYHIREAWGLEIAHREVDD